MEQVPMARQQVKRLLMKSQTAFKTPFDPDIIFPTNTGANPTDVDKVITLTKKFTVAGLLDAVDLRASSTGVGSLEPMWMLAGSSCNEKSS